MGNILTTDGQRAADVTSQIHTETGTSGATFEDRTMRVAPTAVSASQHIGDQLTLNHTNASNLTNTFSMIGRKTIVDSSGAGTNVYNAGNMVDMKVTGAGTASALVGYNVSYNVANADGTAYAIAFNTTNNAGGGSATAVKFFDISSEYYTNYGIHCSGPGEYVVVSDFSTGVRISNADVSFGVYTSTTGAGNNTDVFASAAAGAGDDNGGVLSLYGGTSTGVGTQGYTRVGNSGTPATMTPTFSDLFVSAQAEFDGAVFFDNIIRLTPDAITSDAAGVAASVTTSLTEITTDGDQNLDNVTLAAGADGQIKVFSVVAVGNVADSVKVTPASMIGGTQITFAASPLGLGCIMCYDAGAAGWIVVANNGGAIA